MFSFLKWYLILFLIGVTSFPINFWIFKALKDKGYAFNRILGIFLWGYILWILGSLGIINNDGGGILFSFGVILFISVLIIYKKGIREIIQWVNENSSLIIIVEVLFLMGFAGWALIRAGNPEIIGTEKPMELAFINSILRSRSFPPHDPWLSGFAISYYYFGYILVSILALVTKVPAGIAFNLGIAMVFGLSVIGAYGVLYNLLVSKSLKSKQNNDHSNLYYALLGPLYVLLLSNIEGFLEILHSLGLFWQQTVSGELSSGFWSWLGILNLSDPPSTPFGWSINRHWWWWRASRVINDLNYSGGNMEVINEFPFFSFLLADLHPHVLSIPFVLLAIAIGLNLYLGGAEGQFQIFGVAIFIKKEILITSSLLIGGLAFLNFWDFPIYAALFTGSYILFRAEKLGWRWGILVESGIVALILGVGWGLFFSPFLVSFSSQAGGILPNVINPTRTVQLWVMFGPLFIPIFVYLFHTRRNERGNFGLAFLLSFGVSLLLWIFSLIIAGIIVTLPEIGAAAIEGLGAPNAAAIFSESLRRRIFAIGTAITLIALLTLSLSLLLQRIATKKSFIPSEPAPVSETDSFQLLMMLVATLLVTAPEYIYLRDLFQTRMNTVFKFYYQAWILWGIAGAYSTIVLLKKLKGIGKLVFQGVMTLVILIGLVYPLASLGTGANDFNTSDEMNLDGTLHATYLSQDDRSAVIWLQNAELGTLVEAVGGSYTNGGRISVHSGMPTVLGWPFHENQWRGGVTEMGSREIDIQRLYQTNNRQETIRLIDEYDIKYIYLGSLERNTYSVNDVKFRELLQVAFQQGDVIVFEVP